jgi:hypothetical protein
LIQLGIDSFATLTAPPSSGLSVKTENPNLRLPPAHIFRVAKRLRGLQIPGAPRPMKIITRWWWIVAACAATAQTLMAAKAGEPGGSGEYRDFKVLKTYFAKEGEHIFRAFVIEWEGQEVIAVDAGALIKARSDDTINVLVSRGLPRSGESFGRILFLARPEKKPPLDRSQIRDTPADVIAANPPVMAELRVNKVYALQDGDYAFRAYEVEWQGREVVVSDPMANTTYEVGETLKVMVTKRPYPDHSKPHGLLDFHLMPQRSATRLKRR